MRNPSIIRRLFSTIALLSIIFLQISSFSCRYGTTINYSSRLYVAAPRLSEVTEERRKVLPTEGQPRRSKVTKDRRKILPPGFIEGPPIETKPNYENIHGPLGALLDKVFLSVFRSRMAENIGVDSDLPADDYQGLMELTAAMNARFSEREQVQNIAQNVLRESLV